MSDLLTRTVAPIVSSTSKRLGVDLPKPVTEALEHAERVAQARRQIADVPNLTAAIAAAAIAGKDPLASKDVQRALLVQQLDALEIEVQLKNRADSLSAAAFVEHADEIVDTWRPTVERAEEAMAEVRRLVPGLDMTDDQAVTRLPAAALTPWGRARECLALLDTLVQGWQQLALAAGLRVSSENRHLILADVPLAGMHELSKSAKATAVASLDVPLELADLATFAARVERLNRERREAQEYEDAAADRARELRRQNGWGAAVRIPGGMVQIP